MSLLAGCRIAVAPKFHLSAGLTARLSVGSGVEEVDGKFFPLGPWRSPTPEELALLAPAPSEIVSGSLPLLDDPASASASATEDNVALFSLPAHLRETWWRLVDAAAESGGPMQGFDDFAAKVAEFLAFKRLHESGPLQMEVLVTAPGERSIRVDSDTGQPAGLGSTMAPWSAWPPPEGVSVPRLVAVANLGDEPTGVVFFNLSLPDIATELTRRASGAPRPATVGELACRFLKMCSDYPPVRLQLGPGEACRLPRTGLILDGDMTGKMEPGVLLLISQDGPPAGTA